MSTQTPLSRGCRLAVLLAIGASQTYDADGYVIPNAIERQAIGDRDNMTLKADGSLDIYIQIEIDPAGPRASGSAGVHRWNAPCEVGNGTMQIGQAVITRRAGPPELMHQEQSYAHN
jgi:heat shock protein HslJ